MFLHKSIRGCILICTIILSTTACQPTPEKSAVQEKGNLNAVINENAADKNNNGEEQAITTEEQKVAFNVTAAKGKFTVNVDAMAIKPKVKNIPVVNVVRNDFKEADIKKLCKAFFGNNDILLERSIDEMSKEELQKMIDNLKGNSADPDSKLIMSKDPNYIKKLENLMKTAPDKVDVKPVTDFKFKEDTEFKKENNKTFTAKGKTDDGKEGRIFINTSNSTSTCNFTAAENSNSGYYVSETNYNYEHGKPSEDLKNTCKYSKEDAQKLSDEVLKKLGVSNEYGVSFVENAAWVQSGTSGGNVKNYQGYMLHYTRKYEGISENYDTYDGSDSIEEVNSLPYGYEKLTFLVSDNGVVQFDWSSPMKVEKVQASNVKTLDLKNIEESFKKQIPITYAATSKTTSVRVSELRFGYMRVKNVNEPTKFTLVPVWDFISDMYGRSSLMTVNAMDGSILDRRYGY